MTLSVLEWPFEQEPLLNTLEHYANPADVFCSGAISDLAENGLVRYARHPDNGRLNETRLVVPGHVDDRIFDRARDKTSLTRLTRLAAAAVLGGNALPI
jgi:hypothetical protein